MVEIVNMWKAKFMRGLTWFIVAGALAKAAIEVADGDRSEALTSLLVASVFWGLAREAKKRLAIEASAQANLGG